MAYGGGGGSMIALSMLSLVAGMFLLIKACREEICCKAFAKVVAYAVVIISILLILCGGVKMVTKCARHGWGQCTGMKHKGMMMMEKMRPGMMPMMRGMQPPPPPEEAE